VPTHIARRRSVPHTRAEWGAIVLIRRYKLRDAEAVRALFVRVNQDLAPPGLRDQFDAYVAIALRDEIKRIPGYYGSAPGRGFWVVEEENGALLGTLTGTSRRGRGGVAADVRCAGSKATRHRTRHALPKRKTCVSRPDCAALCSAHPSCRPRPCIAARATGLCMRKSPARQRTRPSVPACSGFTSKSVCRERRKRFIKLVAS
jgi:hypothetical protein